jgi:nesprin-1
MFTLYPAITDEYEALKKLADSKLASLIDLLQGRKQFEADIDQCQHWLNEAEVATSAEIRAPNVELLEEQLSKVTIPLMC